MNNFIIRHAFIILGNVNAACLSKKMAEIVSNNPFKIMLQRSGADNDRGRIVAQYLELVKNSTLFIRIKIILNR